MAHQSLASQSLHGRHDRLHVSRLRDSVDHIYTCRYLAGLPNACGPGDDLLSGHAGIVDRKDHHQPDRTLGQSGTRGGGGRIEIGAGRQHRQDLFPRRCRSRRRLDADQLAGAWHAADAAAQHPAAGGSAVRSDGHHAAGHSDRQQPEARRSRTSRTWPASMCATMLGAVPGVRRTGGGRRQGSHDADLPRSQEAAGTRSSPARCGQALCERAT